MARLGHGAASASIAWMPRQAVYFGLWPTPVGQVALTGGDPACPSCSALKSAITLLGRIFNVAARGSAFEKQIGCR
jgi:hypothetical protein